MNLKQSAEKGVFWLSIGNISVLIIEFVIGILLARIIGPNKFGLVAIVSIFTAISDTLINSGLSQSLIQNGNPDELDYTTISISNIVLSLLFYILLFCLSPFIANYFNSKELIIYLRVLSFTIVLNAIGLTFKTRNIIELNFHKNAIISIASSLISALVALYLLFNEFGIWALIFKNLIRDLMSAIFLLLTSAKYHIYKFEIKRFIKFYKFGIFLLLSGLISTLTEKIYYFLIAKKLGKLELSFYSRTESFITIITNNIFVVFTGVGFTTLSKIKDDSNLINSYFKDYVRQVTLAMILVLGVFYLVSDEFVYLSLGDDWSSVGNYIKWIIWSTLIYIIYSLNLNLFNVVGNSKFYFYLQTISNIFSISILLVSIKMGIKFIFIGLLIKNIITLFACFYLLNKQRLVDYLWNHQIYDHFKILVLIFLPVLTINNYINIENELLNAFLKIAIFIFINHVMMKWIFRNKYYENIVSVLYRKILINRRNLI